MEPAKNILYCESNIDGTIGGSFFSLLYLVEGLDKARYTPTVVFYRPHALLADYERAGAKVVVMPPPMPFDFRSGRFARRFDIAPIRQVLRLLQSVTNFIRFLPMQALRHARYLKAHRIDLVHLNNSVVRNHDWILAASLTGIKCVTHDRGIRRRYPWLTRVMARWLDTVICISEAVRDNLSKHGMRNVPLRVIYNGVDPQKVRPRQNADSVRATLAIQPHQPVIGIVGNIREWKGQETVVRATAGIKTEFPDIVCLLVGDIADTERGYADTLRELVRTLGLERNIIFTGYTKNVADYLQIMDVVLHASVDPEPFGRVLIEAMAMRKPVIGSRAGAVPEIIEEGVTGLTFPPRDWRLLEQQVRQLLRDPALRQRMGASGYERLLQRFHVRTNVARTEEVYAQLLQEPR